MDFERDYILRMIQMMGDFMRRVAEMMDDAERARAMDGECRRLCGMPLSAAETLDAASLIELSPPVSRFMLAELLYVKAKASSRLPYGEADALLCKALRLLASLADEPRLCDLRAARLAELKQDTLPLLDAADLMACARFFAQAERYDEMEDALFQAIPLAAPHEREAAKAEAAALLRAAAHAPEQALALCGMTAAELRASARELETQTTEGTGEPE